MEDVVSQHPAVTQCVAFATPHRELGEVVGLAAVLRHGAQRPSLVQIREFGRESRSIEAKWLPELLVWMSALPKVISASLHI